VSVAYTPEGDELWVSNHVSDTVSVIDARRTSRSRHTVIRTIQELDPDGATLFDEPVGLAFASGKGYVALSSRNDIAVIDRETYQVQRRIHITAQDPRAIAARDGLLYVAAFESGNQSELSVCPERFDPPQCTLGPTDIGDFVTIPNLPGREKLIVIDPDVPDRDLFVIDTASDTVVDVVDHVGTLLYGVAVASDHRVFVTHTDARNAVNGNEGENLVTLENRVFENRIAVVPCGGGGCGGPDQIHLEPPLPAQPGRDAALATPYGIAVSEDDAVLLVTAAGTSRVFSVDAASGAVLDAIDTGTPSGQQIPKGLALRSDARGAPQTAYVLNTLDNSVSIVDVRDPEALALVATLPVGADPTPESVRLGRIAFMNAFASDSATFSCESCHPDGNTDQLLWRIGGGCFFGECTGDDAPRTTMPVRGLAGTLPLHWDGTLGDPIGGRNGALGPFGDIPPSCQDDASCFRHLVDAGLSGVMCDQDPQCAVGGSGLPGRLSQAERQHMARFLASVSYPPARSRRIDDGLSESAVRGLSDFFVDHGGIGSLGGVRSCGDMNNGCHALPLLASTNSPTLQGFDAPTLRGISDRFIQFSLGMNSSEEALAAAVVGGPLPFGPLVLNSPPSQIPWDPAEGFEEQVSFAAAFAAFEPIYRVGPIDIFQMLEESSTGHSGATGRQLTLDAALDAAGEALMDELEAADGRGVVSLRADGRWLPAGLPVSLFYRVDDRDGPGAVAEPEPRYVPAHGPSFSSGELRELAREGRLLVTLTAGLPGGVGPGGVARPLLSPQFVTDGAIGNPNLPLLSGNPLFAARAVGVGAEARTFVDGQPAEANFVCANGVFEPYCSSDLLLIRLESLPQRTGMHTLQLQNPDGELSNEFPFCVGASRAACL
jgi:DNA-binding beta-propeller fold protein YncE